MLQLFRVVLSLDTDTAGTTATTSIIVFPCDLHKLRNSMIFSSASKIPFARIMIALLLAAWICSLAFATPLLREGSRKGSRLKSDRFPLLHNRHFNPHRKIAISATSDFTGHPGWLYYNLILSPSGEGCDVEREIAMQYGYERDTCLVVYDDASNDDDNRNNNFPASSIMFTCTDEGKRK